MKLRLARILIAVALAVSTSGVSAAIASLADECCEDGCCPGAVDGKHCPPNCAGPCAKFQTALQARATPVLHPPREARPGADVAMAAPTLPVVLDGVFHPPRH